MKRFFTISTLLIAFGLQNVFAQLKLVQEYHENTYLCSSSLFLYSEGLYFSERGCENNSTFSCGTYTETDPHTLLIKETPMDSFEYILNVTYVYDSSYTGQFKCYYKTLDDSLVYAYLFNQSLADAEQWKSNTMAYLPHDWSSSFVKSNETKHFIPDVEPHSILLNKRTPGDTVALCLEAFQYLNNEKEVVIISPLVSEVTISINLPYEILRLALMYTMTNRQFIDPNTMYEYIDKAYPFD